MSVPSHLLKRSGIAFIGLGRMGFAMADNLFVKTLKAQLSRAETKPSTVPFIVCDAYKQTAVDFANQFHSRNQDTPKESASVNVEVVDTPAEAAAKASLIVTMLPSSPHVREVYEGDQGIIAILRAQGHDNNLSTLCIDSTTLDFDVARDVGAKVAETGAAMIDAPVSGGVVGAKAGTLTFMVGGALDPYTRAMPYLSHMGKRVLHCGPSGAGLAAKLCNNLLLGVEQIAVSETMLLGARLGLAPHVLAGVINTSTGRCWSSEVNNPVPTALSHESITGAKVSPPCEREYEGGFATELMLKDVRLGLHAGRASGSPLPMSELAEALYRESFRRNPELSRKDFSSTYKVLESVAESGESLDLEQIIQKREEEWTGYKPSKA